MTSNTSSPFIYKSGASFISLPSKPISEEYARKCFLSERLTPYDRDLIRAAFVYGYVTRHQLEALFPERTDKSLKRAISKLVDNGFFVKHYCAASDNTSSTFFYSTNDSLRRIIKKYVLDDPAPCFYDPVAALKTLANNALYIAVRDNKSLVSGTLEPTYRFSIGGYTCRCGTTFSLHTGVGDVLVISLPIRRNENWEEVALNNIRMIYAYDKHKGKVVFPLCLCEDLVHIRQLRLAIAKDDKLDMCSVLYTYDTLINASDDPLAALQRYQGLDADGTPLFSTCHFS